MPIELEIAQLYIDRIVARARARLGRVERKFHEYNRRDIFSFITDYTFAQDTRLTLRNSPRRLRHWFHNIDYTPVP